MGRRNASGVEWFKAEPAARVKRLRGEVKRKPNDRWHDSLANATTLACRLVVFVAAG